MIGAEYQSEVTVRKQVCRSTDILQPAAIREMKNEIQISALPFVVETVRSTEFVRKNWRKSDTHLKPWKHLAVRITKEKYDEFISLSKCFYPLRLFYPVSVSG